MKKQNAEQANVQVNDDVFWYHKESASYKFDFTAVPSIGQVLSVPEELVDKFIAMYSNHTGKGRFTVKDIADYFETDENVVKYILRVMDVTHGDAISAGQLKKLAEEDLEEGELDQRLMELARKNVDLAGMKRHAKKMTSSIIQSKAEQWDAFQEGLIDPWNEVLKKLEPVKVKKAKRPKFLKNGDEPVPVILLNDLHIGDSLKPGVTHLGNPFDTDTLIQRVEEYADFFVKKIEKGFFSTKEAHIMFLGDLLDSLKGITDRGTIIETEEKGNPVFDKAVDCLQKFMSRICDAVETVHVHCVGGNHDHFIDHAAVKVATAFLMGQGRLKKKNVTHYSGRFGSTLINDAYFLFEHGNSHQYRGAKTKTQNSKRAVEIPEFMLEDPLATTGQQSRVFLCGDLHHEQQVQFKTFDFVKAGALVGANAYARENGYGVKPSQTILGITPKGIEYRMSFHPSI